MSGRHVLTGREQPFIHVAWLYRTDRTSTYLCTSIHQYTLSTLLYSYEYEYKYS